MLRGSYPLRTRCHAVESPIVPQPPTMRNVVSELSLAAMAAVPASSHSNRPFSKPL